MTFNYRSRHSTCTTDRFCIREVIPVFAEVPQVHGVPCRYTQHGAGEDRGEEIPSFKKWRVFPLLALSCDCRWECSQSCVLLALVGLWCGHQGQEIARKPCSSHACLVGRKSIG